jgi:hypothetical protein
MKKSHKTISRICLLLIAGILSVISGTLIVRKHRCSVRDDGNGHGMRVEDIRSLIDGQSGTTNDYYHVFDKMLPLTAQTSGIIRELLDEEGEKSNLRVTYLLNGIAARCGAEAGHLVPHIQKHLAGQSACVQIAALCAVRSIGNPARSLIGETAKCLKSPNAFVRINASETLSAFDEDATVYLPALRTLLEVEEKNAVRSSYQKTIAHLEQTKEKDTQPDEGKTN